MQYQGAVRSILNAGAHKPVPGATLERADAELGLMLALGLRRYVGRMTARFYPDQSEMAGCKAAA